MDEVKKSRYGESKNSGSEASRLKKGFSVGPANLPDSIHKRKGMLSRT